MTIRPGEEWGVRVDLPASAAVAHTDAEAASADRGADVVLAGGDLHRSVGSPGPRDPVQRVDVDGLRVRLDGGPAHWGIAHVVMRRGWWRGPIVAVMNVDHLGDWYVAPRAHPGDGRFDVVEVSPGMSRRDRLGARTRLPTGAHVPHPDITTSRSTHRDWEFVRPVGVWLDGVRIGTATSVDVELVPDHYVVHF